jgi:hypothetical protein
MTETMRLLLLLGLAGTATTFLGSLALWWLKDERRIRRALRHVLRDEPEAVIIAQGRGRGAGVSFAAGLAAVAWDKGSWCLVYRIDELSGAELIVDGRVVARVFRGEPRRPLEQTAASADQVQLRLIFDDARYPDFELDLWLRGDENRRDDWSPRAAIQEANRWMARADAIVRRPARPRAPAPEVAARPAPRPEPPRPAPPEPVYAPKPLKKMPPPAEPVDDDELPAPPARFARPRTRATSQRPPWEGQSEFDFDGEAEDYDDPRGDRDDERDN